MLRIFSGWGNIGGSTVAFINLVNAFNKAGHKAILYTPHDWAEGKCKHEKIDHVLSPTHQKVLQSTFLSETLERDDIVICHFTPLSFNDAGRGFLKKVVYTSHETDVCPVKKIKYNKFDFIHYVSEFQRKWHGLQHYPSVVIPNIVSTLTPMQKTLENKRVGGVIGSIDSHKRTHKSIKAALEDGCDKVLIFGAVTHPQYWELQVAPLCEDERVEYCGVVDDKSLMYSNLDVVYHSSPRETYNYIEAECQELDIPYIHTDKIYTKRFSNFPKEPEIIKMWEDVLGL